VVIALATTMAAAHAAAAAPAAPAAPAAGKKTGEGKQPGYDPNKLLAEGKDAAEVFLAERRDEFWADVVEQTVGAQIQRDLDALVPGAKVGIQCKSLSCVVQMNAPKDKEAQATAVAKVIMFGPTLVQVEPTKNGHPRWIFFCEPRMGDARFFVDWYRRVRRQTFQAIKAGKRPNPLPFPTEKLPDA
jgi:hypothetical protein